MAGVDRQPYRPRECVVKIGEGVRSSTEETPPRWWPAQHRPDHPGHGSHPPLFVVGFERIVSDHPRNQQTT
jgi:hypothetical protein